MPQPRVNLKNEMTRLTKTLLRQPNLALAMPPSTGRPKCVCGSHIDCGRSNERHDRRGPGQ
jgi:hypothetical protein